MTAIAILGIVAFAAPGRAGTVTYDFQGTCSDCSGSVTAELVLQNYALGANITLANLVSFTYGGSNLVTSFTSLPTDSQETISGVLPGALPAAAVVNISDSTIGKTFSTALNGTWSVGTAETVGSTGSGNYNNPIVTLDDQGISGTWSNPSGTAPSVVPEPASLALVLPGLIGLLRLRQGQVAA
jgi:hypothetical protein